MKPNEDRANEDDFLIAKAEEVDRLRKLKVLVHVNETDVPKTATISDGRFILSINTFDTPEEKARVRYVAQGFKDHDKKYSVH